MDIGYEFTIKVAGSTMTLYFPFGQRSGEYLSAEEVKNELMSNGVPASDILHSQLIRGSDREERGLAEEKSEVGRLIRLSRRLGKRRENNRN